MRVELVYAPGCNSYTKARTALETVIAEEGLPVPVELTEESGPEHGSPMLRINGNIHHGAAILHHIEQLRDAICKHWKELTEKPLAKSS